MKLHFLFTEPPGPTSQFVECEDDEGNGVNSGEWSQREDGFWELVVDCEDFCQEQIEDAIENALIDEASGYGC